MLPLVRYLVIYPSLLLISFPPILLLLRSLTLPPPEVRCQALGFPLTDLRDTIPQFTRQYKHTLTHVSTPLSLTEKCVKPTQSMAPNHYSLHCH